MVDNEHDFISLFIGESVKDLRTLLEKVEHAKTADPKHIKELAKEINPSKTFLSTIDTLLDAKMGDKLPEVIKYFDLHLAKKLNLTRLEVLIRSAKPLKEDQINKIITSIETQYKLKALVKTEVDPSLIGGLVVKINDKMIDLSFRTQMSKLRTIVS